MLNKTVHPPPFYRQTPNGDDGRETIVSGLIRQLNGDHGIHLLHILSVLESPPARQSGGRFLARVLCQERMGGSQLFFCLINKTTRKGKQGATMWVLLNHSPHDQHWTEIDMEEVDARYPAKEHE